MQKWLIRLLVLAAVMYVGRELVLHFERGVRDNDRAQAEIADHLAKRRATDIIGTIQAGQAARVEQLQRAVEEGP